MGKFVDLTGHKYNKWTVLRRVAVKSRKVHYLCQCECGTQKAVGRTHLVKGNSKSCRKCSEGKDKGIISTKILQRIIDGAKKRKIYYNLGTRLSARKYLYKLFNKQKRKCAISGVDIHIATKIKDQQNEGRTASLDRIDSSKGYIRGNVQWVHKKINIMKWDMNKDELISWCKTIVEFNK